MYCHVFVSWPRPFVNLKLNCCQAASGCVVPSLFALVAFPSFPCLSRKLLPNIAHTQWWAHSPNWKPNERNFNANSIFICLLSALVSSHSHMPVSLHITFTIHWVDKFSAPGKYSICIGEKNRSSRKNTSQTSTKWPEQHNSRRKEKMLFHYETLCRSYAASS